MTELIEKIAAVNEMITTAKKRSEKALSDAKCTKTILHEYSRQRLHKSLALTAVAERLTRYRNNLIKQLSAMIAEPIVMYTFTQFGINFLTTDNEAEAKQQSIKSPNAMVEVYENGKRIDKQLAKDIFNP